MATEAPKRSTRERKASSKVRVFDQNMRNEIKRKRLDSLEADNWHEERRTVEEADDDDYNPLDENGIVDSHPEVRNFHFANGFSGHGVQQSPAAGRAVAELICHGGFRTIDLSRLNYARIAKGEALREVEIVEAF